jgi:hypothetical protein
MAMVLYELLWGGLFLTMYFRLQTVDGQSYELLWGGLFLTTLGSILLMARVTVLARRQVAVLIGLVFCTTPSAFVSVHRGNL